MARFPILTIFSKRLPPLSVLGGIDTCLASNDGEIVKAWALAGHGLIVRSEWDVSDDLRARRLVRVLPGYRLPSAPIVALIGTRREARAARVDRFLQVLIRHFPRPGWRS
jgi:DNA-binding transcriptional LysR family regulator